MNEAIPLAHSQLSLPLLADFPADRRARLLGITCLGGPCHTWHGELPVQNVAVPVLGHSPATMGEIWYSAESCRSGTHAGIRYRVDENVLYGVVDVDPAAFPAGSQRPVQFAAENAYRHIFELLDREGYPHLWRVWNYLSEINREQGGLERYRQFNIGRQDAFRASGRLTRGAVPAACVLGTVSGPLTIAFMAGRSAPVPIENPRQVSAYDYPGEYGPRSPTFSRAAFAHLPGQELLFISGTASIVGHRTTHLGDVAGQAGETLTNIAALLDAANARTRTTPYGLADLHYRVYLRHAEDYPRVLAVVDDRLGAGAPVIYVQADICRADLLVEIEAMASHPMGNG